jgi:hypothetical protein
VASIGINCRVNGKKKSDRRFKLTVHPARNGTRKTIFSYTIDATFGRAKRRRQLMTNFRNGINLAVNRRFRSGKRKNYARFRQLFSVLVSWNILFHRQVLACSGHSQNQNRPTIQPGSGPS